MSQCLSFANLSILALIWRLATRSEFSKRVFVIRVLVLVLTFSKLQTNKQTNKQTKLLVQVGNSQDGNHLQAVRLNCWNSVHVNTFGTEIKQPNVTALQFNYFHLHIAGNTVDRYTEMVQNKFIVIVKLTTNCVQ